MNPSHVFARSIATSIDIVSGAELRPSDELPVPLPRHIHIVLRLHGHLIGDVSTTYSPDMDLLSVAREYAWENLRPLIEHHLAEDGLPVPETIEDLANTEDACSVPLNQAPENAPFITVALATVGNEQACLATVDRILSSTYPNFELVVVDNSPGATDFGEMLSRHTSDERVRFAHETRKGLSFARNRGLQEARGEIVIFTDDDVMTDPGWLFAFAHNFAADAGVACVTGSILAAEIETPAQAWLEQYGGYNKGFQRQVFDLDENRLDTPLYPYDSGQFGSGANIAFRADVLRKMGAFSVDLGAGTPAHGGEDIDILRRVITSGNRLVYEPSAFLWHYHRRSYAALRRQMFRYGVGLSATVTKWLIEDPRTTIEVARRLPAGARHVLSPNSKKNRNKTSYYPRRLTWLERAGLAAGPFLYLKSRAVVRGRK
jgi:O-antigen biosynthesis protein